MSTPSYARASGERPPLRALLPRPLGRGHARRSRRGSAFAPHAHQVGAVLRDRCLASVGWQDVQENLLAEGDTAKLVVKGSPRKLQPGTEVHVLVHAPVLKAGAAPTVGCGTAARPLAPGKVIAHLKPRVTVAGEASIEWTCPKLSTPFVFFLAQCRGETLSTNAVEVDCEGFLLAHVLHARGGTPLLGETVQIVDPATGEDVGEPFETDEKGRILVFVPENKAYGIRILDDDGDDTRTPEEEDPEGPGQNAGPRLFVRLTDGDGDPLPGVAYQVEGPDGFSREGEADEDGDIEVDEVEAGVYRVTVGDGTFPVHTLDAADLESDPSPYAIVVEPSLGTISAAVVKAEDLEPLASTPYRLEGEGRKLSGTTDGEGRLHHEKVPFDYYEMIVDGYHPVGLPTLHGDDDEEYAAMAWPSDASSRGSGKAA